MELALLDSFYPEGKARKGISSSRHYLSISHKQLISSTQQEQTQLFAFLNVPGLIRVSLPLWAASHLSKTVVTQNPPQRGGGFRTVDLLAVLPQPWLGLVPSPAPQYLCY